MKPHLPAVLLVVLVSGCSSTSKVIEKSDCATSVARKTSPPRVTSGMNDWAGWVNMLGREEGERVLLSSEAIAALNERNRVSDLAAHQDVLADAIAQPERVQGELDERIAWLDEKLKTGEYTEEWRGAYDTAKALVRASTTRDTLHVAAAETDIRCVPMVQALFKPPATLAFDRNRCSRLHVGEVVRVLREVGDDWLYVHAGHSVGWLQHAVLTPAIAPGVTDPFRGHGDHAVVTNDMIAGRHMLRMGRRFPLVERSEGGWLIELPTATGFERVQLPAGSPLHAGPMPLTRANVWRLALARLGEAYGWGGYQGGRDCSRLLLDLFSVFGVRLGRHSKAQAHSGSTVIDLGGTFETAKDHALRAAAKQGIVLVYMPGHIMLHLGEFDGHPYALSAITEYLRPCGTDGLEQQVVRLDRVAVTDYELGRDTGRAAFIQRLTALAIFGESN